MNKTISSEMTISITPIFLDLLPISLPEIHLDQNTSHLGIVDNLSTCTQGSRVGFPAPQTLRLELKKYYRVALL